MESSQEIHGEYSLLQEILQLLLKKGYPAATLIPEWKQGGQIYDLAVVDPLSSELVAAFEFLVSSPVVITSTGIREKIQKYQAIQAKAGVPLYIVDATQGRKGFSLMQFIPLAGENEAFLDIDELPGYEEIKRQSLGQKLASITNTFSLLCWISASATFILLILDWFNILIVNPERLALIGVIIALVLLPYLRKIKILGVEIERTP